MKKQKAQVINIKISGEILPGSISPSYLACGKKNCACYGKNPKLHGPYYRWTGFINNKKTTVTISGDVLYESQKRIDNYKQLMEEIESIKINALKNAPWIRLKPN